MRQAKTYSLDQRGWSPGVNMAFAELHGPYSIDWAAFLRAGNDQRLKAVRDWVEGVVQVVHAPHCW